MSILPACPRCPPPPRETGDFHQSHCPCHGHASISGKGPCLLSLPSSNPQPNQSASSTWLHHQSLADSRQLRSWSQRVGSAASAAGTCLLQAGEPLAQPCWVRAPGFLWELAGWELGLSQEPPPQLLQWLQPPHIPKPGSNEQQPFWDPSVRMCHLWAPGLRG